MANNPVNLEKFQVPCCPDLSPNRSCDRMDFQYRQIHNTLVTLNDRRTEVAVEVIIRAVLERCPGPLELGDLAYSTTLLPGEKVRLFTTDRRTQFTYDSTSKLSYRTAQTQEEHYYMAGMSDFMSDLTVRDSGRSSNTSKGKTEGHGETSGFLSSVFGSPSVDVSGSYDASSTSDFLRELSQHAEASHRRVELGVRGSSSVSVGEVQTRTHTEAESQDHFESASREFANPNRCRAVTFYFYRINKTQTVKFTIEGIERRVIDPAADTKVTNNSFTPSGGLKTIPAGVLATQENRLQVEQTARTSVAADRAGITGATSLQGTLNMPLIMTALRTTTATATQPMDSGLRQTALRQVDADLVKAGLLDKINGNISPEAQKKFSFEAHSSLPTPGLVVKGCLDECEVCEPARRKEIELDLERKHLENELLKRQIELLDKDQEHRCCPAPTILADAESVPPAAPATP